MKGAKVWAGFIAIAMTAAAGEGLRGPVAGYVFDARQAVIRPIEGLPGAARLGDGFAGENGLADCSVASRKRLAVCRTTAGESWMVVAWPGDEVTTREIAGLAGPAETTLLSDSGELAAVHFESSANSGGRLVWLRYLGREAAVDFSQETGPGWRMLAMAPEGNRVLMTSGSELWVVDRAAGPERLASGVNISAAAFSKEDGVFFADQGARELWKLERAEAGTRAMRVMILANGVDKPTALTACASGDGEQVGLVDGNSAQVDVLHLSGQRMEPLPVWGRPNRMVRLNQDGLYVLNQPGEAPLLLFDCGARAAYFVPVD